MHNGRQLVMTSVLGLILVWFYTILGSLYFRSTFVLESSDGDIDKVCDGMFDCFLYTLNMGFRNGGGIGDALLTLSRSHSLYYERVLFDMTFFIVMVVLLLNLIFGVVLDSFGELREESQKRLEDTRSRCFVCGYERAVLDRDGNGFNQHIQNDHNLFSYVSLYVYLRYKNKTTLTGLESYVWSHMFEKKTLFFPVHQALCLDIKPVEGSESAQENKVAEDTKAANAAIRSHIERVYDEMSRVKSQASQSQVSLESMHLTMEGWANTFYHLMEDMHFLREELQHSRHNHSRERSHHHDHHGHHHGHHSGHHHGHSLSHGRGTSHGQTSRFLSDSTPRPLPSLREPGISRRLSLLHGPQAALSTGSARLKQRRATLAGR